MVFALVASLAAFVKVRYLVDKAVIDNAIARLHYRFTAAILFLGCLLCTANAFIGNPIECLVPKEKESMQKVVNTYCWITSTFTLPIKYKHGEVGVHVAHPGVGAEGADPGEMRYHAYYQWVPFVLFFQGLLFYAPHWFWKNWENGKIRMLSEGIRGTLAETREERKDRQSRLVQYIVESTALHNWYAFGYLLCEVFNFSNVIANIYLTNRFLGGKFLRYGVESLYEAAPNQLTASTEIFPRVTKCMFHYYGPSGTIQKMDSMCVLALNIINEKIYLFLWWWFIILAILSGLALFYSIAIIASPAVRRSVLFRRFKFKLSEGVRTIVSHTKVGDFFLLHLLGQNVNMVVYTEILEELSKKLEAYMPSAPNSATLERMPIYPTKESFPLQ